MRTRGLEPDHVWMAAWAEGLAGRYGQVKAVEQVATAISERAREGPLVAAMADARPSQGLRIG
jgi:hypothetical protein